MFFELTCLISTASSSDCGRLNILPICVLIWSFASYEIDHCLFALERQSLLWNMVFLDFFAALVLLTFDDLDIFTHLSWQEQSLWWTFSSYLADKILTKIFLINVFSFFLNVSPVTGKQRYFTPLSFQFQMPRETLVMNIAFSIYFESTQWPKSLALQFLPKHRL